MRVNGNNEDPLNILELLKNGGLRCSCDFSFCKKGQIGTWIVIKVFTLELELGKGLVKQNQCKKIP